MWNEARIHARCRADVALGCVYEHLKLLPRFQDQMSRMGDSEVVGFVQGWPASWGEQVSIGAVGTGDGGCDLRIVSHTYQLFDWGRTRRNVEYVVEGFVLAEIPFERGHTPRGHGFRPPPTSWPAPPAPSA
jgi:hypothetical protein